ncbi:MAG: SH3 domain-containing protein [Lentimicrobiaceae bacterium]|nr:SH3 domain-containing protein [Lentimicrobiaceae bacterium]
MRKTIWDLSQNMNHDKIKMYKVMTKNINFEDINKSIKLYRDLFKSINIGETLASLNKIASINLDAFKCADVDIKLYASALKNVDFSLLSNISFDPIKFEGSPFAQTVDYLSSKETKLDDSDYEKINDLSNYALEMTSSKELPVVAKKAILLYGLQKIWKIMGIPQVGILVAIILFCLQTFDVQHKEQKIIIRKTMREIIIIQRECKELILRCMICDEIKVYKKPNTKSTAICSLDCGNIVEVLEKNKKWIYIRAYKTNIEGWVQKKYTKKSQ